jgi:AcrR family transcriptional regulator
VRTQPSTARGRDTVKRVLDAACVLFARQGIRATTLDQVGSLSGTGRGQLYLFFAGKSDLVAEVVRQQVDRVLDAQQPLLGTIATADDVHAWCELATTQYNADDPIRCPIGSLVHELGEQDITAQSSLSDGFTRWRQALAEGLWRVHDNGQLAPGLNPDAVAAALLATYQGGVLLGGAARDLTVLRLAMNTLARAVLAPRHEGEAR